MRKIVNPWLDTPGYSCPGCCPTNPKGLKLEFYEDGDDIVSVWKPDTDMQSWADTVHGGIQCLIFDEIAGWVIGRKLNTIGVTSRMEIKYDKPVTVSGGPVEIRARIQKQMRQVCFVECELYQRGEKLTTGIVTYFCSTPEKAKEKYGFTGCVLEDE